VSQYYGFARETADLDVLGVIPLRAANQIEALAGKGSPLHRKHHVYVERVGIASFPDDYESRLIHVFPLWRRLKLWALAAHDLALTSWNAVVIATCRMLSALRGRVSAAGYARQALSERDAAVPERVHADMARHNPGNVGQSVPARRISTTSWTSPPGLALGYGCRESGGGFPRE